MYKEKFSKSYDSLMEKGKYLREKNQELKLKTIKPDETRMKYKEYMYGREFNTIVTFILFYCIFIYEIKYEYLL